MLKAFTPVAVLIFSYIAGIEKTSSIELYIITIICIGVALTSAGETYFSWIGFIFQSLGILAESSRLVLTNILMKNLKLDPLSSLYYIAPLCCLIIGTCCGYFEAAHLPFERMVKQEFLIIFLFNGFVAFALNVAVVLLISNTSVSYLAIIHFVSELE